MEGSLAQAVGVARGPSKLSLSGLEGPRGAESLLQAVGFVLGLLVRDVYYALQLSIWIQAMRVMRVDVASTVP